MDEKRKNVQDMHQHAASEISPQDAVGPASDPSQPAAWIVAEIDRALEAGFNAPYDDLLQRARDEIVRKSDYAERMDALSEERLTRITAFEAEKAALAKIPREPTTEMMLAGMAVQDENDGQDTAGVWRAMYDAFISEHEKVR